MKDHLQGILSPMFFKLSLISFSYVRLIVAHFVQQRTSLMHIDTEDTGTVTKPVSNLMA